MKSREDITRFEKLMESARALEKAGSDYEDALEAFNEVSNPDSGLLLVKPDLVKNDGRRYRIEYDGEKVKGVHVSRGVGDAVKYTRMFHPENLVTLRLEIVPDLPEDSIPFFEPWKCFDRIKEIVNDATETGSATIKTFNPIALDVLNNIIMASNYDVYSPYNLHMIIQLDSEFKSEVAGIVGHNPVEEALDQIDNSFQKIMSSY